MIDLPKKTVEFVILGIILFFSIFFAFTIKDYVSYSILGPCFSDISTKCLLVTNETYVILTAKKNITNITISGMNTSCNYDFLEKDNQKLCKIDQKIYSVSYIIDGRKKSCIYVCEENKNIIKKIFG